MAERRKDVDLPAEIWTQVFDIAADEGIIFDHALPTVMAKSAWFKSIYGEWTLRTSQESLNLIQRRSYATKKAIISTCKSWRRYGSEFLFRCLFFDDPTKLRSLAAILESEPTLGWWTRRIHITRYYAGRETTMEDMESALISIISHCPNLEIFIVDWPMGSAFGVIADALCTHARRSLSAVSWYAPAEALPKVIWALDSLPNLQSIHLNVQAPQDETIHLGAAEDICLSLPNLQQISLHGFFQEFLEQATGWNLPSLRSLSFDFGNHRHDIPDLLEFLLRHGSELTFLDLNCIPTLDVAKILDICPALTTFTFNADWRLPVPDTGDGAASLIANRPHENITHIGCHGLLYAFGVGYAAAYASADPLRNHLITRTNERNFAALTRANFPALKCVRALSRTLLRDLNAADGPDEKAYPRWEKWWEQCARQRIRFEDCTGAELGNLPQDEESDESDEEEDEEEEEEEESGEWEEGPGMGGQVGELRQLLEECRKMSADREEPMFTSDMGWQGTL